MKNKILALSSSILALSGVVSAEIGSRYVPSSFTPSEFLTTWKAKERGWFSCSVAYGNASSARGSDGEKVGIGEIFGKFDLKDVIRSLTEVYGAAADPFQRYNGYETWGKLSTPFIVDGEIWMYRLSLSGGYSFGKENKYFIYAAVPFLIREGELDFILDRSSGDFRVSAMTLQEEMMVQMARREAFERIGLSNEALRETAVSELHFGVGANISMNFGSFAQESLVSIRAAVIIPIINSDRDWDNPASYSHGTGGFFGAYAEVAPHVRLKSGIGLSGFLGLLYELPKTHERRIARFAEPDIFSAIKADVQDSPGLLLRTGAELVLTELGGGLGAYVAYVYQKQWEMDVDDKRPTDEPPTYLSETTLSGADDVRSDKKEYSSWSSHYVTLKVEYDSVRDGKSWRLKPVLFAKADIPVSMSDAAKLYSIAVGVTARI